MLQKSSPSYIAEGDTVLIQEDKAKLNTRKFGIIEDLIRGKDNMVRGAKVRELAVVRQNF